MNQRRLVTGLVVAAALLPTVAACGLDAPDETSAEHPAIQAASNNIGSMDIRDVFIMDTSDAQGNIKPYIVATLVNNSLKSDTLTSITTSIGAATLDDADAVAGGVTVPPRNVGGVQLSDPLIDGTAPSATITTTKLPTVGTYVNVTFSFTNAGQAKAFAVPVVDTDDTLAPTAAVPTGVATPPAETAPDTSD